MQRLATIDEAQKKIESLTGSVVSLQELLGDKRSRGAFGEVQLEGAGEERAAAHGVRVSVHALQRHAGRLRVAPSAAHRLGDGGLEVPLENYHRMFDREVDESERTLAQRQFRRI